MYCKYDYTRYGIAGTGQSLVAPSLVPCHLALAEIGLLPHPEKKTCPDRKLDYRTGYLNRDPDMTRGTLRSGPKGEPEESTGRYLEYLRRYLL